MSYHCTLFHFRKKHFVQLNACCSCTKLPTADKKVKTGRLEKIRPENNVVIEVLSDKDYASEKHKNKIIVNEEDSSKTEQNPNRKHGGKTKHVIMVIENEGALIEQKTLKNQRKEHTEPDNRMTIDKGITKDVDEGEEESKDIENGMSSTMRHLLIKTGRQENFIEHKHILRGGYEENKPMDHLAGTAGFIESESHRHNITLRESPSSISESEDQIKVDQIEKTTHYIPHTTVPASNKFGGIW